MLKFCFQVIGLVKQELLGISGEDIEFVRQPLMPSLCLSCELELVAGTEVGLKLLCSMHHTQLTLV